MKILKFAIPVLIIGIGYLGMKLLSGLSPERPSRTPQPRPKIVEVEAVQPGPVASEITAFGRLQSAQPVNLFSEVAGELMTGSVAFQPGQSFRKGDLLLKIDPRQAELSLNSAKSDLLTALATVLPEIRVDFPDQYQIWQTYFDNCRFDRKLDPLPAVSNQKIKLFLSRFNVYRLYFNVRNLEILLDKHYITAPFNGAITAARQRSGSTVRNGSELGTIINLDRMEVEVPIAAADLQWIDRNKPVRFTSSEVAGEWKGRIARVGKAIDTRTQTVPVFMTVDKSGSSMIYDGVFLRARIPGKVFENALAIPVRAIYNDHFVYLLSGGQLAYREVEIARRETESVIVTGGLASGDTLVTEVLQGVAPGMPAVAKGARRTPQTAQGGS